MEETLKPALVTMKPTTNQPATRLEALAQLEQGIESAVHLIWNNLKFIRDEGLYDVAGYKTFGEYMRGRWGKSESAIRVLIHRLNKAMEIEQTYSVTPCNSGAVETVKKMIRDYPDFANGVMEVIRDTVGKNGTFNTSMVRATLDTMLESTFNGYVDVGGEISLQETQCKPDEDVTVKASQLATLINTVERNHRQRQHAIDGDKRNGWCKPILVDLGNGTGRDLLVSTLGLELPEDVKRVEIKVKVVS